MSISKILPSTLSSKIAQLSEKVDNKKEAEAQASVETDTAIRQQSDAVRVASMVVAGPERAERVNQLKNIYESEGASGVLKREYDDKKEAVAAAVAKELF